MRQVIIKLSKIKVKEKILKVELKVTLQTGQKNMKADVVKLCKPKDSSVTYLKYSEGNKKKAVNSKFYTQ